MTVSSLPSGTRVATRGIRARALRSAGALRSAAAVIFATALMLGIPLGTAAPVAATAPAPTPGATTAPAPDPLAGQTVLTLSPVGRGTVSSGEGLAVSVTLQNRTDTATPTAAVTLSLGNQPLSDRSALTAWLGGDTEGVRVAEVGSVVLAPVPAGADATGGIVLDPGDPALAGRTPGVYPLVATTTGPDGSLTSTSAMIVPGNGPAAVGMGIVVPITAGPTAEGLLTAAELLELTSVEGSLTRALDAVTATDVILAVDPAIAAAIRVLGTSAPAGAVEWLERLDALPNSRFALQFGDADVAAQLEAGQPRPLEPTSLQHAMRPADFPPPPPPPDPGGTSTPLPTPPPEPTSPTPTPNATTAAPVDPAAPVYPTMSELLDIGTARPGVYWPATGTATIEVVSALGAVAVDNRPSLTLVPSAATVAGAGGATVPAHAGAAGSDLLVYDSDVSRELQAASLSDRTALRGASLTAAAAYLSFAAAESGGAPLLVTLDRAADRSTLGIRTAIDSALQTPGATPLGLGALAAAPPVEVQLGTVEPDPARSAAASALFADETAVASFSSVLDDPRLLTGPERAEILQVLGAGWMPDPAAWTLALDEHRAATALTLDSVGILPPTTVNLLSADAPLQVWVRNDLPYPATVVLHAAPDDLRLTVQDDTTVVAGALSNTRVQVPVRARVGSGEVGIELQLRSGTSEPIGATQVVDVNVRAEWEGIGIAVLAVLVGGFVLLGIVRTVLRLRARRRHPAPQPDATALAAEPPAAAATETPAAHGDEHR